VRLCVGHQHSPFWPILAGFVDYYSLFWGPGVISTIDDPGVRLHVGHQHSSKLVDLVNFGQFSMLLPTNFGSRGDPKIRGTPGSGYGDVVKTRIFGPFWPVFYAITH
jgi:hypothetical protein